MSAELKMLRFLQERVNKSTKDFDARPEAERAATRPESDALAGKQARVQDLMRRLAAKLGNESAPEGGR
ncbi:MAG: hypothetical protein INH34_17365 [Phycisphaerales bacterium]|nr:hypothetical protein [Phycisphaerales bacterium]